MFSEGVRRLVGSVAAESLLQSALRVATTKMAQLQQQRQWRPGQHSLHVV